MQRPAIYRHLLHLAILTGLVVAGTKFLDSDEFVGALARFDWRYLPPILALSLAYLCVKAWRFAVQLRHLAGASRGVVTRGYIASQAATLIPGGFAMRAAILEQAGVPPPDSAASIAVASLSDVIVLLVGALIAALWFETARRPVVLALTVLILLSLLLSLEAVRSLLRGGAERLAARLHLLDRWQEFLGSLREAAASGLFFAAIGYGVLAFGLLVVALDLCMRGVGSAADCPTLLLAVTLPTLLGWLTPLPGGAGVTDVGMIGILNAADGVSLSASAAAVLIFRAATLLFAALVSSLVYLLAWRGQREQGRLTPVAPDL
jgi:uncharacterized membrane protein YbhN (UPF0104 family)